MIQELKWAKANDRIDFEKDLRTLCGEIQKAETVDLLGGIEHSLKRMQQWRATCNVMLTVVLERNPEVQEVLDRLILDSEICYGGYVASAEKGGVKVAE